jgi:arsenate reductase
MAEIGIDISKQRSKTLDEFQGKYFDYVVTVCDNTGKICPVFSGAGENIHHTFFDPAEVKGAEKDVMLIFRAVRDEIRYWIMKKFG